MEPTSDRIIQLYRRHADAWVQARGDKLIERTWIDWFADLLHPGSTVLDLGCGAGKPIATYIANQKGFAVTGVDGAPEMIAKFRTNLPGETAIIQDMRTLNLKSKFGGVIAWDSFFHLTPEFQRQMFPIFGGHTEPGAPLLFTSGPSAGESVGTLAGEPLYHASLDPEEYREQLHRAGFSVYAQKAEDPNCGGRTVWLARRR